jgi:predicted nucleic acid-binding protein
MIVVADTTPLHYLILIQQQNVLERLFGHVLIPPAVAAELKDPSTSQAVSSWITRAPLWLQIQAPCSEPDRGLDHLDPGEREAITLAAEVRADQLLT